MNASKIAQAWLGAEGLEGMLAQGFIDRGAELSAAQAALEQAERVVDQARLVLKVEPVMRGDGRFAAHELQRLVTNYYFTTPESPPVEADDG